MMKKVLITGAGSYIGTSFEKYVNNRYPDKLDIKTIDMLDGSWRSAEFARSDIVFHVAGIAHADTGKASDEVKAKYYAVNRDLAIETAEKAKAEGVKQFVFMSSVIIYGDSAPFGKTKVITADTVPSPAGFYGDSKWQADQVIRELADESFTVTVLRPPFIYGKGCKGNYRTLSAMAKKLPVFPKAENERSMLYIENLCEFLVQVMERCEGGIFHPQNAEYTKTSDMVRMIGEASGKRIRVTRLLDPAVRLACIMPGKIGKLTNKAFGNMTIDRTLSRYDFDYSQVDLKTSIERTESI